MSTNASWPPPPDLASIEELVRDADPEGLIAGGAPDDEYEPESKTIFAALHPIPSASLTAPAVLMHLEPIWQSSFGNSAEDLSRSRPALESLTAQIERFFGPAAEPQTRSVAP